MLVVFRSPSWLPSPRKKRSPAAAAIVGFLFGGIGLGLYFRSVLDFLIPVLCAIASVAVGAAAVSGRLGYLAGALIAARWGYYRARQCDANARQHPSRGLPGFTGRFACLPKSPGYCSRCHILSKSLSEMIGALSEMTLMHIMPIA